MIVLIPVSLGGERPTNEAQYTSSYWTDLPEEKRTDILKQIALPESGVCLEFNHEEATRLIEAGFNNGPFIRTDDPSLLGIKTQTIIDDDSDTVIKFLGIFRQDATRSPRKTNLISTAFPNQLERKLKEILMTGPGLVNR